MNRMAAVLERVGVRRATLLALGISVVLIIAAIAIWAPGKAPSASQNSAAIPDEQHITDEYTDQVIPRPAEPASADTEESRPARARPSVSQSDGVAPSPTPVMHAMINRTWLVSPSLEERIVRSSTVVRASFVSALAATEMVPTTGGGTAVTHRGVQLLRFTAHDYLKGSGNEELIVFVPGDLTFPTAAQALWEAEVAISSRNTTWDNQQAILFFAERPATADSLRNVVSHDPHFIAARNASRVYRFPASSPLQSAWDYSIEHLSRSWIPLDTPSSSSEPAADFLLDIDAVRIDFPVVDFERTSRLSLTLEEVETEIAAVAAFIKSGENVDGFSSCVDGMLNYKRHRRASPVQPLHFRRTLVSGSARGTEIDRLELSSGDIGHLARGNVPIVYNEYSVEGVDADLFHAMAMDDDQSPATGYANFLGTSRPLPLGNYNISLFTEWFNFMPCNFNRRDYYEIYTVTVTAPNGTVHEAFFDPVVLSGGGVGADTSGNGVLRPQALTFNGTTSALESLSWQSGKVTLTLTDGIDLTGLNLDFINLNGNTALSLKAGVAPANSTKKTYTWPVASAPWAAGDLLMIRLRDASTTVTPVTPTATPGGPTPTPVPPTSTPVGPTPTPVPPTATPGGPTPTPVPPTATPVGPTPTPVPPTATPTPDAVVISVSDASAVSEGEVLEFRVTLSTDEYSGDILVNVDARAGTATEGQDYTRYSNTLRFTNFTTEKIVRVRTYTDYDDEEGPETVQLVLSSPIHGVLGNHTATGTIKDVPLED